MCTRIGLRARAWTAKPRDPGSSGYSPLQFMPAAAEIWGIEERVMWSIHLASQLYRLFLYSVSLHVYHYSISFARASHDLTYLTSTLPLVLFT